MRVLSARPLAVVERGLVLLRGWQATRLVRLVDTLQHRYACVHQSKALTVILEIEEALTGRHAALQRRRHLLTTIEAIVAGLAQEGRVMVARSPTVSVGTGAATTSRRRTAARVALASSPAAPAGQAAGADQLFVPRISNRYGPHGRPRPSSPPRLNDATVPCPHLSISTDVRAQPAPLKSPASSSCWH